MADLRIILVEAVETGRQALERAGDVTFIVIHFTDDRYAVIKPGELKTKLSMWKMFDKSLGEMPPNVLAPHLVETIQEGDPVAQGRINALKSGQALAVLSGKQFIALYVGGQTFRGVTSDNGPTKLSAEPPRAVEAVSDHPEKRYINVELHDSEDKPFNPSTKPLDKQQTYGLIFDVDVELRAEAIVRKGAEFGYQFKEGEQLVKVAVRLESQDFDFFGEQEKTLLVPRVGKSKNKAAFLMQPLHDGECQINAIFLKDGNFIQVIVLKFVVGEIFSVQTLGREVNTAFGVQPRDVSLTILNTGAAFQVILISPGVAATAVLPLKLPELQDIALQARDKLMAIVDLKQEGLFPFQKSIDISEPVSQYALQQLAEAGFRLYQRIFFSPSADEQTKNMGRKLRELAQREKLKVQIFSQDFVLPWGLLYMAERFDPNNINPELFLGIKHIIEHIPLQQSLRVTDNRIGTENGLAVGLNVNADIDGAMKYPLVGNQLEYWEALKKSGARVTTVTRKTTSEVTNALSNPDTPDQVLYFYCHGISKDVDEQGGVDTSTLVLSGDGRLTLEDLNVYSPTEDQLPHAPLVFINACESAQLSPLVYDGFVPYFMAKGARGVIGTEVETPALFAVEWARRFFDRFLKGESLGEIFLALRREFFEQHHNLLGLLYALYVDGDTRLEQAVVEDT